MGGATRHLGDTHHPWGHTHTHVCHHEEGNYTFGGEMVTPRRGDTALGGDNPLGGVTGHPVGGVTSSQGCFVTTRSDSATFWGDRVTPERGDTTLEGGQNPGGRTTPWGGHRPPWGGSQATLGGETTPWGGSQATLGGDTAPWEGDVAPQGPYPFGDGSLCGRGGEMDHPPDSPQGLALDADLLVEVLEEGGGALLHHPRPPHPRPQVRHKPFQEPHKVLGRPDAAGNRLCGGRHTAGAPMGTPQCSLPTPMRGSGTPRVPV